ncbi:MAG TPA: hypothetical protein VFJ58_06770 [Armatimonadota bacterium]|nr:hypothetical protein [Armatimonadota bacterium]
MREQEQEESPGNGMTVCHVYDAAGRETLLANAGPVSVESAAYAASYGDAENRVAWQELYRQRVTWYNIRARSSGASKRL